MNTVIGALLILAGAFFTLIAAIGLVRLKDPWSRMHAASKPQLLGMVLILAGIAVEMWDIQWVFIGIVIVALQIITAPVGSHLIARAIDRTQRFGATIPEAHLSVDDLAADLKSYRDFDSAPHDDTEASPRD
ncbi:monovalent cation/H(+) antiporter subunit G [Schaalia sp. ZJ405]|uniref:monovalent cation/H(+) antiporter subunit G n=1 Tax=Schaalia sp. ZJ405 TaxID=2709403 RepID=UPI0013EB5D4F|nr:monovalent cation/H(+) antiporter subunit G [Schaalia sp. ZJ405]QPK81175.1 monovalent cation/H(+) antiporter subunit G [Schaalia sp. ZJ405]